MRVLATIILTFSILVNTDAQFDILKQTVETHYAGIDSKLAWEKQMKGQIDDQTTIYLYLLTDAKSYYGAYSVAGSDQIHLLEGEQTSKDVLLLDFSLDHQLIGTINGDFADHVFYANWLDKNETEELSFIAHEINSITNNQSWVQSFGNDNDYFLISNLNSNYNLTGIYKGQAIQANLSCFNNDCKQFNGDIITGDLEESIPFMIDFTSKGISVRLESEPHQQYNQINTIALTQIEDNSKGRTYAYYPLFEDGNLTEEWFEYDRHIKKTIGTDHQFRSSLDVTIDYLSKRYASGILRYQDNKSSTIQELSFVIDFKKNKVSDPRRMLKEMPIQNKIFSSNSKINLDDCTYSYGANGIIIRSPFNLLYGQETIVLPFKDFKTKKLN